MHPIEGLGFSVLLRAILHKELLISNITFSNIDTILC